MIHLSQNCIECEFEESTTHSVRHASMIGSRNLCHGPQIRLHVQYAVKSKTINTIQKMSAIWYSGMYENTMYTDFETFKADFNKYVSEGTRQLKKDLNMNHIPFTKSDSFNVNKLAFVKCGGKNTKLAKQKPGPNKGSYRKHQNTKMIVSKTDVYSESQPGINKACSIPVSNISNIDLQNIRNELHGFDSIFTMTEEEIIISYMNMFDLPDKFHEVFLKFKNK